MKFDILKLVFLFKKIHFFTSCILFVVILFIVLLYYQINLSSLSYLFNVVPPTFIHLNVNTSIKFNVDGPDVLVFLHIQKTGGTLLERSLTKDGLINFKCQCEKKAKRCNCLNKIGLNWVLSRYSTGWCCGLHADWTELSSCVVGYLQTEAERVGFPTIQRKTHWLTLLRDPISRYLSEWKHVQRGATWRRSKHLCQGRSPSLTELPPCYGDIDWSGVSLSSFARCHSNLATNRQTRMLADLTTIGCYNQSWPKRNEQMLRSAKINLSRLAFYGLLEHLILTQYVFHRTFGLAFVELWAPLNVTHSALTPIDGIALRSELVALNALDLRLYAFAENEFLLRVAAHMLADRSAIERCCRDTVQEIDWTVLAVRNSAVAHIRKKLVEVNTIITRLLVLDGSSPPARAVLAMREERWQRKIRNDMREDYDNSNEY